MQHSSFRRLGKVHPRTKSQNGVEGGLSSYLPSSCSVRYAPYPLSGENSRSLAPTTQTPAEYDYAPTFAANTSSHYHVSREAQDDTASSRMVHEAGTSSCTSQYSGQLNYAPSTYEPRPPSTTQEQSAGLPLEVIEGWCSESQQSYPPYLPQGPVDLGLMYKALEVPPQMVSSAAADMNDFSIAPPTSHSLNTNPSLCGPTSMPTLSPSPPAPSSVPSTSSPKLMTSLPAVDRPGPLPRKRLPNARPETDPVKLRDRCLREGGEPPAIEVIPIVFRDGVLREVLMLASRTSGSGQRAIGDAGYMNFVGSCPKGGESRYYCRLCGLEKSYGWKNSKDLLNHLCQKHFGIL
jgi:hypothetical protein